MQRSDLLLGLYILVPVIFLIIPDSDAFAGFFDPVKYQSGADHSFYGTVFQGGIADVSVSDDSADDNAVSSVPERWIYP